MIIFYCNHTQTEKLCAAHWREEQKNTRYIEALHTQNIFFIHRNIWWMGFRKQTSFCHSCGQNFMSHQAKSCVTNQLYQRLAITLQWQDARAMIARQPL